MAETPRRTGQRRSAQRDGAAPRARSTARASAAPRSSRSRGGARPAGAAPRTRSGARPAGGGPRARGGLVPAARVGSPVVRFRLLAVLVIFAVVVLGGRLMWVQGLDASARAEEAVKQRTVERTISPLRGDIVDRDGAVMARSVERYDLWVNQLQVGEYLERKKDAPETGAPAAAKALAPLLGKSVEETQALLTGESGFQYLLKNVEPAVRDAVVALKIPGIGSDRVADRIYPAGQVGGNVIGFVGADGAALGGAELSFDDRLRGTSGSTTYERGSGGQILPNGRTQIVPAVDGQDLVLTLDSDLQWKAQQVLADTVGKFGASGGSAVALNIRTGEVLALAETPTYDPNDPGATDEKYRGNQSLSNVFEPGSTGKLLTVTTALEQGTITPTSQFTAPYTLEVDGETYRDSHEHETKRYTVAGILKDSSNTGTVQIAQTVTPQQRYDTLRAFGLGEPTGVGLAGESAGILHPVSDWHGRMNYTTSFGQGYAVTPLQMVSALGAFGNGGVRMHPTLVAGTRDGAGVFTPAPIAEGVRATDPETAAQVMTLMDNDIPDDGTANAGIPGYAVGGKTGTAQVAGGTYTASFIGMAPMDDPEIIVGVFVYGLTSFVSGNTAASPAFAQIMGYALQTQGIAPTGVPGRTLENEW
ncbi:penicillin-binding protein 2 [Brachybacterium sp. JHP9]|uniref:Penicillin-binding protein 2 n=1 Tax=Brachybacterium equifaecis TaxID=2910770 RepID=A0ABT0QWL2_9MICO|nr:penicillin-binding protein 2 [Brachybacterium equifaecis]MCL6422052.1 penicillin-binding protein 2 [Brachybacterium equifaecis]